ncbi:transglutaminase-like cysteine peptidase [Zoogloea sp.]|uniref:transglutaminase-like cysteine peptidase n=1 Tax=Zoogloea sp. TaxID=49181 RepID=UPI0025D46358|nr:transglutaminase-like cysteine peptidase [Zoogloea sp.]
MVSTLSMPSTSPITGPSFLAAVRRQGGVLGAVCLLGIGLALGGFEVERMRQVAQQRFGQAGSDAIEAWRSAVGGWRGLSEDEQLRRINEYFNRRIRFAEDSVVWSQADYWATPLETLARGAGDCEDFVFAKYFTLRELGVPEDRLRMTYVRAQVGGAGSSVSQAHMVLGYYPSPDAVPLVLDNLITEIRPASGRPDLVPVFSFNMQGVFVGGAAQATSPVDRVSRWRELLLRMRSEGYTP